MTEIYYHNTDYNESMDIGITMNTSDTNKTGMKSKTRRSSNKRSRNKNTDKEKNNENFDNESNDDSYISSIEDRPLKKHKKSNVNKSQTIRKKSIRDIKIFNREFIDLTKKRNLSNLSKSTYNSNTTNRKIWSKYIINSDGLEIIYYYNKRNSTTFINEHISNHVFSFNIVERNEFYFHYIISYNHYQLNNLPFKDEYPLLKYFIDEHKFKFDIISIKYLFEKNDNENNSLFNRVNNFSFGIGLYHTIRSSLYLKLLELFKNNLFMKKFLNFYFYDSIQYTLDIKLLTDKENFKWTKVNSKFYSIRKSYKESKQENNKHFIYTYYNESNYINFSNNNNNNNFDNNINSNKISRISNVDNNTTTTNTTTTTTSNTTKDNEYNDLFSSSEEFPFDLFSTVNNTTKNNHSNYTNSIANNTTTQENINIDNTQDEYLNYLLSLDNTDIDDLFSSINSSENPFIISEILNDISTTNLNSNDSNNNNNNNTNIGNNKDYYLSDYYSSPVSDTIKKNKIYNKSIGYRYLFNSEGKCNYTSNNNNSNNTNSNNNNIEPKVYSIKYNNISQSYSLLSNHNTLSNININNRNYTHENLDEHERLFILNNRDRLLTIIKRFQLLKYITWNNDFLKEISRVIDYISKKITMIEK